MKPKDPTWDRIRGLLLMQTREALQAEVIRFLTIGIGQGGVTLKSLTLSDLPTVDTHLCDCILAVDLTPDQLGSDELRPLSDKILPVYTHNADEVLKEALRQLGYEQVFEWRPRDPIFMVAGSTYRDKTEHMRASLLGMHCRRYGALRRIPHLSAVDRERLAELYQVGEFDDPYGPVT